MYGAREIEGCPSCNTALINIGCHYTNPNLPIFLFGQPGFPALQQRRIRCCFFFLVQYTLPQGQRRSRRQQRHCWSNKEGRQDRNGGPWSRSGHILPASFYGCARNKNAQVCIWCNHPGPPLWRPRHRRQECRAPTRSPRSSTPGGDGPHTRPSSSSASPPTPLPRPCSCWAVPPSLRPSLAWTTNWRPPPRGVTLFGGLQAAFLAS